MLLADDRAENLVALTAALAPLATAGAVRLLTARSAEEALRHALSEGDRLAVALLDVRMPGTDGPETARLIRARRRTEHVPIIFVTAHEADRRAVTMAYQSGAVDYVAKPYDPDVLRAKVSAFVELHRRRTDAHALERRRFADETRARTAHASAQATAQAEARFRAVLDALPDAVVVLDARWRSTYANPAAQALLRQLGVSGEAIAERPLWDAVPTLLGGPYEHGLREAAASQTPRAFEAPLPTLTRWYDVRVVPEAEGTLTLWLRDITARRDADGERERLLAAAELAQADAERATRAKSHFLATMSHELRTPLNAIGGHVQLLELGIHGPITDPQRESLARIQRAQGHLLGIINDVLDLARIESGRIDYRVVAVPLVDALSEVAALIAPQAAAKGLTLDVATQDAATFHSATQAWADPERLRQVLLNLLSNAVKFTDRGGVRVDVGEARTGPAVDPERIEIRVRDTGIGIASSERDRIFEPFVQAEVGHTRRREGTGLGLAISRDLARGMGGDLTVETELGVGSTFSLTLRRTVTADGTPVDRRSRNERRDGPERRQIPERRHGADRRG